MKRLKIYYLALLLPLLSCGNQTRKTEYVINYDDYTAELEGPDTVVSSQEETPKSEENPSIHSSSSLSSRSNNSFGHDGMSGFDPASEDDMDDNGMSRYIDNNDEEGWE